MLKALTILVIAAALAGGVTAWQWPQALPWAGEQAGAGNAVSYVTAEAARGDVRRMVSTAGPVSAVITVQVGSQLSGQVEAVLADHNSEVKAGDVMARIDPKTYESRVAQAKADLQSAEAALLVREANLNKAKAVLAQTEKAVDRNRTLARKKLTPEVNLESAQRDLSVARAEISVADAEIVNAAAVVAQRKAQLGQAEIDLSRTVIRAPIEGTVISRTIDVGQTVAASLQAPELFRIAQDLSKIRIEAQVNEADIGNIAQGNPVSFTVDAYPDRGFTGTVEQVRLAATTLQNVVTYTVIITSVNEDRKLFPGMTANATIETGIAKGVLKVPNEALRFRPRDSGSAGDPAARGAERMKRMIDTAGASIGLEDAQKTMLAEAMTKAMAELRPSGGGLTQQADPRRMREQISQRFEKELAAILKDAQRDAFETWKAERESAKTATIHVLGAGGVPEPRFVRLGLADDKETEIVGGEFKEGETVILRVREGAGS